MKETNNILNHKHIVFCQDHYNPLGAVRSLGEAGIFPICIIVSTNKPRLVNKSKYVSKVHTVPSIDEGYAILINFYSQENFKPFVYTCSDDIESFLDLHYNELIEHFYFFNAGHQGRVTSIMEKSEMAKLAVDSGLDIPKSEEVKVGEFPKTLRYPILTKSVISTTHNWKSNVFLCHNEKELADAYKNIKGEHIILQEYITKKNELCLDGVSVNGGEEIYLPIQSEYIRFLPTSYGEYVFFQKYKETNLLPKIKELFKRTGFSGVFSIEFLRDNRDNFYFLEINFRNSTWSYAHTYAGVNLLTIWAQSTLKGSLDSSSSLYHGKSFTAMAEWDDFYEYVKPGRISLWQWISELRKSNCYFYYNHNDPKPLYSFLWHGVLKRFGI